MDRQTGTDFVSHFSVVTAA